MKPSYYISNLTIYKQYRGIKLCLLPSDFSAAFAYCVMMQNPNKKMPPIAKAIRAFDKHVALVFPPGVGSVTITYEDLATLITEQIFENIPAINALNKLEPDFISLGALARNVFYMIIREYITQTPPEDRP